MLGAQCCVCVCMNNWLVCVRVTQTKFTSTSGPNLSHSGRSTTCTFKNVSFTGFVRTVTEYIHLLSPWTISTWIKHFGNTSFTLPFGLLSTVSRGAFWKCWCLIVNPFTNMTQILSLSLSVTKQPPVSLSLWSLTVFCCLWQAISQYSHY